MTVPVPPSTAPQIFVVGQETITKAESIWNMLLGSTDGPGEAEAILCILFTRCWLASQAHDTDLETALAGFCETMRLNIFRARNPTKQ